MSGEEIHQSEENQQPLDEGVQSLADMPTFEQKISRETQDKSYEEARRDGILPEGVRDEQDYREYQEQKRAYAGEIERKRNEKIRESYDFLKNSKPVAYTDDMIDALLYQEEWRTEKDENGTEIVKINENGKPITFIDKAKLKPSFEYMFDNGISLKDLSDGQIINMSVDGPRAINKFVESYYFITDSEYFPEFNKQYEPMRSLHNIIESRKNHAELSEESRDFAYACYPSGGVNNNADYPYEDNDVAERLLFGGSNNITMIPGLATEIKRVCTQDSAEKYLDRIGHLSDKSIEIEYILPYSYLEDATLQSYYESQEYIEKSVWGNMHNIFSYIENNKIYEPYDIAPDDWSELASGNWQSNRQESYTQMMGASLLRYVDCGYSAPMQGYKECDLNPTSIGLGEAMMMAGISPDTILDTYFGGEHGINANYEPAYAHLEARHIGELLNIGIPRESIITNIRNKNEKHDLRGVSIQEKEIKRMREAGISNSEILDAMAADAQLLAHDPFGRYHREGFTDADVMEYLAMKLKRAEQE